MKKFSVVAIATLMMMASCVQTGQQSETQEKTPAQQEKNPAEVSAAHFQIQIPTIIYEEDGRKKEETLTVVVKGEDASAVTAAGQRVDFWVRDPEDLRHQTLTDKKMVINNQKVPLTKIFVGDTIAVEPKTSVIWLSGYMIEIRQDGTKVRSPYGWNSRIFSQK